jgi:hypothetical protein
MPIPNSRDDHSMTKALQSFAITDDRGEDPASVKG